MVERNSDRFGSTMRAVMLAWLALAGGIVDAAADPAPFESSRLTPAGEYPSGIEGPAVDAEGVLYVVNFRRRGTIGKIAPGAAQSTLFATLPAGSVGNGIRFDRAGRMFVADYKKHNVLVIERGETTARVYFHSDDFHQPNDLAIAADGTLFASDPLFPRTGRIWRIDRGRDGKGRGQLMSSDRPTAMGVTNGLDLSPDGSTLYVSESNTREVWAYRIDGARLTAARRVQKFDNANSELDGLRTDVDGKIYVARPGAGTIAVLAPDAAPQAVLVREIALRGSNPTNLTFGGPDGKSVFVTQGQGGFVETFRSDRPGREPCLQAPGRC